MADGFIHTVYRDGNWINELGDAADNRTLPGNHDTNVAAGHAAAISRQRVASSRDATGVGGLVAVDSEGVSMLLQRVLTLLGLVNPLGLLVAD